MAGVAVDEFRGFDLVPALFLDAKLAGRPIKAFVDTGAGITLAALQFVQHLGLEDLIDTSFSTSIQGIHQETNASYGRIHNVTLQLGDQVFPVSVVVVAGATMDFILGIDFMTANKVAIDFRNGLFRVPGRVAVRFLDAAAVHAAMASVRQPQRYVEPAPAHGSGKGSGSGSVTSRLLRRTRALLRHLRPDAQLLPQPQQQQQSKQQEQAAPLVPAGRMIFAQDVEQNDAVVVIDDDDAGVGDGTR